MAETMFKNKDEITVWGQRHNPTVKDNFTLRHVKARKENFIDKMLHYLSTPFRENSHQTIISKNHIPPQCHKMLFLMICFYFVCTSVLPAHLYV